MTEIDKGLRAKVSRWLAKLTLLHEPLDLEEVKQALGDFEEINDDPHFNSSFASGMSEDIRDSIAQSRSTMIDQAKLLTSSLLTLNSAGAFAALQLDIAAPYKAGGLALFVSGIFFGLIAISLGIRAGLSLSGPMGEALGYWRAVKINGFRIAEAELNMVKLANNAIEAGKRPIRWSFASIAAFGIGCAATGAGFLFAL